MRRLICLVAMAALVASAAPSWSLSPGTEVFVPAGFRGEGTGGSQWITTLYIQNPGSTTATVEIELLQRNAVNPDPASEFIDVLPNETVVLDDVIQSLFGLATSSVAFRVVSDQPVLVNGAILNLAGGQEFAQSFAGVAAGLATRAGAEAYVVGLKNNADYRTNIFVIDTTGSGSVVTLDLLDTAGSMLASTQLTLGTYEPRLPSVASLFGTDFANGTLRVTVDSGSVIAGASRVNQGTGDPLTLAASSSAAGAASADGTYQFVLYDRSGYGYGGNIVVANGEVTDINGTYANYDKLDGVDPACPVTFRFGNGFSPTDVGAFSSGVSFSDDYTPAGSGVLTFTITFVLSDNMAITGTIDAVGTEFSGIDEGCNGVFRDLQLRGGKSD